MNTIYIVQYYTLGGGGVISVHFNEEDAEEVCTKFNTEDDGEGAYVEQWEVE